MPSPSPSGGPCTDLRASGSGLPCWGWGPWAGGAEGAQASSQGPHCPFLAPSCLAPRSVSQGTGRCLGEAAGPPPSPVLCRQRCSSGPAPPGKAGRDGQAEPQDPPPPDGPRGVTIPHLCHLRLLRPRLPGRDCGVPRAWGGLWAVPLLLSTVRGGPSACRATRGALQGEGGGKAPGVGDAAWPPSLGTPRTARGGRTGHSRGRCYLCSSALDLVSPASSGLFVSGKG